MLGGVNVRSMQNTLSHAKQVMGKLSCRAHEKVDRLRTNFPRTPCSTGTGDLNLVARNRRLRLNSITQRSVTNIMRRDPWEAEGKVISSIVGLNLDGLSKSKLALPKSPTPTRK